MDGSSTEEKKKLKPGAASPAGLDGDGGGGGGGGGGGAGGLDEEDEEAVARARDFKPSAGLTEQGEEGAGAGGLYIPDQTKQSMQRSESVAYTWTTGGGGSKCSGKLCGRRHYCVCFEQ